MEVKREIPVWRRKCRMMVHEERVSQTQSVLPVLALWDTPASLWISTALLLHLFAEVHDLLIRGVWRSVSLQHLHVDLLLVLLLIFHLFLCSVF